MIEKIFNSDNLTDSDMDEVIVRTKAIIINSKNEILLGYAHKTYQFPGGHLEKDEGLNNCLERELKEELGVDVKVEGLPFMKTSYYTRNYRSTGKNRKNEIYYFIVNDNVEPDMSKAQLDFNEIAGNYKPVYVPISEIENVLMNSIPDNPINEIIVNEMLEVLNVVFKK